MRILIFNNIFKINFSKTNFDNYKIGWLKGHPSILFSRYAKLVGYVFVRLCKVF